MKRRGGALFSERAALVLLFLIVLGVLLSPLIAPHDPDRVDMAMRLRGPSPSHWLGTDSLGRDTLSRLLFGGRASILLSLAATLFASLAVGLPAGLLAGLYRGSTDALIAAVTNIFQGIPRAAFLIALIGVIGPGVPGLVIGITLTGWTSFSRVARAEVIAVSEKPFLHALRGFGVGGGRLVFRHLLPNIARPLIVLVAAQTARTILLISALSFLGLGVQPPSADWGAMVSEARPYFYRAPRLIYLPAAMIFITAWSLGKLGGLVSSGYGGEKDDYLQ